MGAASLFVQRSLVLRYPVTACGPLRRPLIGRMQDPQKKCSQPNGNMEERESASQRQDRNGECLYVTGVCVGVCVFVCAQVLSLYGHKKPAPAEFNIHPDGAVLAPPPVSPVYGSRVAPSG